MFLEVLPHQTRHPVNVYPDHDQGAPHEVVGNPDHVQEAVHPSHKENDALDQDLEVVPLRKAPENVARDHDLGHHLRRKLENERNEKLYNSNMYVFDILYGLAG